MPIPFKVGDVVQLKSGGPLMTISQIGADVNGRPRVWCDWFDGNKMANALFPPESLQSETARHDD